MYKLLSVTMIDVYSCLPKPVVLLHTCFINFWEPRGFCWFTETAFSVEKCLSNKRVNFISFNPGSIRFVGKHNICAYSNLYTWTYIYTYLDKYYIQLSNKKEKPEEQVNYIWELSLIYMTMSKRTGKMSE